MSLFSFLSWQSGSIDALPHDFTWSDRGTVCEYERGASLPFTKIADIGGTSTARVDSVKCKGVLLARKQIFWTGRIPRDEIQREVAILRRLNHHHIVRFIGTYTQGNIVAILLHPVGDLDLQRRLRAIDEEKVEGSAPSEATVADLHLAFGCLASGLKYLHSNGVKHKDIKPANILWHQGRYMFIDFGSSTEFAHRMETSSTGPTSHTELYCAPEVRGYILGRARGRAADIFSLGCVFAEILTVMSSRTVHDFYDARVQSGSHAFYMNTEQTSRWLNELNVTDSLRSLVITTNNMLAKDPADRPQAKELVYMFKRIHRKDFKLFCYDCYPLGTIRGLEPVAERNPSKLSQSDEGTLQISNVTQLSLQCNRYITVSLCVIFLLIFMVFPLPSLFYYAGWVVGFLSVIFLELIPT